MAAGAFSLWMASLGMGISWRRWEGDCRSYGWGRGGCGCFTFCAAASQPERVKQFRLHSGCVGLSRGFVHLSGSRVTFLCFAKDKVTKRKATRASRFASPSSLRCSLSAGRHLTRASMRSNKGAFPRLPTPLLGAMTGPKIESRRNSHSHSTSISTSNCAETNSSHSHIHSHSHSQGQSQVQSQSTHP